MNRLRTAMMQAELKLFKAEAETETAKKTIDLHIYDVVTDIVYDWDNDKIKTAEASSKHVRELLEQNEDADEINIYINSAGGSVYEGLAIYNQLKRAKAHKTVYIDGFACSIASVIAMAGDRIIMPKASMMMIHNAWTCAIGNAKELRKTADDLDLMSDTIANAYLEKSNGKADEKKIRALMNAESYLPADQCYELGLCDEISGESGSEAEKAVAEIKETAAMLASASAKVECTAIADNAEKVSEPVPEEKPETESPEEISETESEITEQNCEGTVKENLTVEEDPKDEENSSLDTFMSLFFRKE